LLSIRWIIQFCCNFNYYDIWLRRAHDTVCLIIYKPQLPLSQVSTGQKLVEHFLPLKMSPKVENLKDELRSFTKYGHLDQTISTKWCQWKKFKFLCFFCGGKSRRELQLAKGWVNKERRVCFIFNKNFKFTKKVPGKDLVSCLLKTLFSKVKGQGLYLVNLEFYLKRSTMTFFITSSLSRPRGLLGLWGKEHITVKF